ncbi:hypothetical protein R6Q57_027682 [Mikania cordata]
MDPHVVEDDEVNNKIENPDCNVRVQMEISVPSSSLKSIVDSENIQLIIAGGSPSSSFERPSISAAIVSSQPQLLDSVATQPQPQPQPENSQPDSLPKETEETSLSNMATNHTTESSPTTLRNLPPPSPPLPLPHLSMKEGDTRAPVPSPPLPPLLSVKEGDTGTPVPTPPSMTIRSATLVSPPPPPLPSLTVTSNTTLLSPPPPLFTSIVTPQPPPPPPPLLLDNGMPTSLGIPPPPPPPPSAPISLGSIPPPPPPAPTTLGNILPPPPPAPTELGSIPPPPLSATSSARAVPLPQPVPEVIGGAPPPPPVINNGGRLLCKSVSKLRRSSQMGCLYRQLKAKVEGSCYKTKTLQRKDSKVGIASGGNERKGMADALAEMTRRSSYFQQIEEDVINYSDSIKEVKFALIAFQTTDMDELIDFHQYVESHLEKLTDETQVLARFEDFPSKKLEGLRMAAALYSKLDAIATNLQNWDIEPPANQLLDRIENYFNKIKGELDTLDRTKDEEIKKFKSQNIHFDFAILTRIKELMVDVSSSCMELALKERKLASASRKNGRKASSVRVLWKAFEFAFRVYSFAGGQDDRAENLTKELAQQIQADNVQ